MKASGAMVQGALAVAGLTAAYIAWQHEPEGAPGEITVLDLSKGDIAAIEYDDPKQHLELVRTTEGGDDITWFTVTPKEAPPAADAGIIAPKLGASDGGIVDAGHRDAGAPPPVVPPPAAAAPPKIRQFRGNELADKLWEKFAPLKGTRALGVLDASKLKEVGLEKPDRLVAIKSSGQEYDFQIGTVAQGVVNPYFRDAKDGKVYLVKGSMLTDLEFASSRLVDRRLHTFNQNELDALKVVAGDATKELTVASDGKVTPKGASAPDAFAKNWSDKVFRLIVTEVLGKGEEPAAGPVKTELKVEYGNKGRTVGWIELGHSGPDVYARTEHTAGWMKLPLNSGDVITEAKKVVTGS